MINDERPPPAFFSFPVAYQGRASSVVVSGTGVERPMGHYRDTTHPDRPVVFGPSRSVDYELEFAAVVGTPLAMRQRLRAADADEHIFGFVVLNDWSGGWPRPRSRLRPLLLSPGLLLTTPRI